MFQKHYKIICDSNLLIDRLVGRSNEKGGDVGVPKIHENRDTYSLNLRQLLETFKANVLLRLDGIFLSV